MEDVFVKSLILAELEHPEIALLSLSVLWSLTCIEEIIRNCWRVETMLLYVQYQDDSHDVVDAHTLDKLIAGNNLRQFYRRSEERWVNVCHDPVRGTGGDYSGPDRRQPQYDLRMTDCACFV
jgi:hypothetical protein